MNRIDRLYEENKNNIVIRENKVKPIDTLHALMDVKEHPLTVFFKFRVKILEENARIIFQERKKYAHKEKVRLHIYEVVKNEKSRRYYEEFEKTRTESSIPTLENEVVYMIMEEDVGVMETNSLLLSRDFARAHGITEQDLKERNTDFANYITSFDPELLNPPENIEGNEVSFIVDVIDVEE